MQPAALELAPTTTTDEREPLSIRHWVMTNMSGMHHVAKSFAQIECQLGLESDIVDIDKPEEWEAAEHADVHVMHTHFPDAMRKRIKKPLKLVVVTHGTPEHVLEQTIEQYAHGAYAPGDGWMMMREYLRSADAIVTFWPRHQAIYESFVPKGRIIDCLPIGVDLAFWGGGVSPGKYAGAPSVWSSENQHRIKWCLDQLMAWPWVTEEFPEARFHLHYIPWPMHRHFIDLANTNGAAYRSYISAGTFKHKQLRNIWKAFDYFWSPVRYGDTNHLFMQAAATGLTTISYAGNPYADFWIREGDQREMAKDMIAIFKGDVAPRADKLPVPSLEAMGRQMIGVYERILS